MSVDIFDIIVKIKVPANQPQRKNKYYYKQNVHDAEHYTSI